MTEVSHNSIVVVLIQLHKFTKNHRIVHLKRVNFMIRKVCLNFLKKIQNHKESISVTGFL